MSILQLSSRMFVVASLPIKIIIMTLYISTGLRYCDHELSDLSNSMEFRIVCPIQRYKNIQPDRIKLIL